MTTSIFRAATALFVLASSVGLVGCVGSSGDEGASPENIAKSGGERIRYEDWAKANLVQRGDTFYFEKDIGLTEEQAHAYYEATVGPSGALWSFSGAYNGIARFTQAQQHNLTWCISSDQFTAAEFNRIQWLLSQAMGAWEAVAQVRFNRITGDDANCSTSGRVIRVIRDPSLDNWAAGNPPGGDRHLTLSQGALNDTDDKYLFAVFQHELGHMLGFAHEHERAVDQCTSPSTCAQYDSPRDTASVMYYVNVAGYSGLPGGAGFNYITQWDLEGAQRVYGAPTDVLNTVTTTLFARQYSTGDIYRRETSGTWTKIGGPGQAFITLNSTLYGQTPAAGELVRYQSGQSWVGLSNPNGQILRCGNAMCATDPNTQDIYRFDGTSWSFIGGGGDRFAATESFQAMGAYQLFGIRPHQDGVAIWSGSGANWAYAGGTTETARELAGGGTNMYRIPTESLGHIEKWDGASWTDIGTFSYLRQVHATGNLVYALNGTNVYERDLNSQWVYLKNPVPFTRLYGSYGYLYGTAVDGTIYMRDGYQTWTLLGKP